MCAQSLGNETDKITTATTTTTVVLMFNLCVKYQSLFAMTNGFLSSDFDELRLPGKG